MALLNIPSDHLVVFHLGVWILQFVLHDFEASFQARLDHRGVRYMEYLERRVWGLLDEEVEHFKFLWWRVFNYGLRVHTGPPIILGYTDELEICNKNVPIVLEHLGALAQEFVEHSVGVDKSRDRVRENDAVDLLRQLEGIIKNVKAHKLELVDYLHLSQVLPGCLNHL